MFVFSNKINLCLTIFFHNSRQKIDRKLLEMASFLSKVSNDLNKTENGELTWFKQQRGPIHQQILSFVIVKWLVVPSLGLEKPKISWKFFFRQSFAKNIDKLLKLRKSCNHKRKINRIYNEKLNYNYFQQLPNLRLKT